MENNLEKGNKKELVTNIGWSYAERMLPQIVTLIVSVVLARLLAPEYYGIIAIVTVFIALGDALAIGGLGNALVQKQDADDKDFNSVCWLSMGVSIVIYTILFFIAPLVARFYQNNLLIVVIRVMGLKVIFSAFNSVQQAYIQKNMTFRKGFLSAVSGSLAAALVGVTMAACGFGIWALVAQYMVNAVVQTVVLFLMIPWRPKFEVAWNRLKSLWNYGSKVLGSTLVYTARDNIRTLIVGKQFSSQDLAFYNQGQKYPSIVVADVVEALGKVLFPALSSKQSDKKQVKDLMRLSIRISGYIMTPLMLGLLAVGDTFVYAVLTEKWAPCIPFLQIMCLAYILRPLSAVFQKGLLAIGKSNLSLAHETITSSATIALLLIAVFAMESVTLIAWSQAVTALMGTVLYMLWSKRYLDYRIREVARDYLPTVLLSIVMAIGVMLVGMLKIQVVLKLVLQVLTGVAIYIGLSWITKNENFTLILGLVKEFCKGKNSK